MRVSGCPSGSRVTRPRQGAATGLGATWGQDSARATPGVGAGRGQVPEGVSGVRVGWDGGRGDCGPVALSARTAVAPLAQPVCQAPYAGPPTPVHTKCRDGPLLRRARSSTPAGATLVFLCPSPRSEMPYRSTASPRLPLLLDPSLENAVTLFLCGWRP